MESSDAPKQVGAVLKDFPEYKEGAGRGVEDIGQVRIVPSSHHRDHRQPFRLTGVPVSSRTLNIGILSFIA